MVCIYTCNDSFIARIVPNCHIFRHREKINWAEKARSLSAQSVRLFRPAYLLFAATASKKTYSTDAESY